MLETGCSNELSNQALSLQRCPRVLKQHKTSAFFTIKNFLAWAIKHLKNSQAPPNPLSGKEMEDYLNTDVVKLGKCDWNHVSYTLRICKAVDYWDKFRDNSQPFYVLILFATDSLCGFYNPPQLFYHSAFPSEKQRLTCTREVGESALIKIRRALCW